MLRAALRRPSRPSSLLPSPPISHARHTRSASTQAAYATSTSLTPLRSYLSAGVLITSVGLFTVYYLDSRAAVHKYVAMPLIRAVIDGETAHRLGVKLLGTGLMPRDVLSDDAVLECELWDLPMSNPVGIAAGLDKNAEAVDGLLDVGFGYVEVGSVTPQPQPGNPQPRFFRLAADGAIINRYGFNSDGHARVLARLRGRLRAWPEPGDDNPAQRRARVLAVNLGKNKSSSPDSIEDYLAGVRAFGALADVLVVNVSSPNTPGLRSLQARGMLEELLGEVVKERDALRFDKKPRVVVKVAPDLSTEEIEDVAAAVRDTKIDGVIMGNTTVQRPKTLKSSAANETGGLSGPPLKPITMQAFQTLRSLLPSSIPVIACGGISSGADALSYAKLGASTVQLYTAFGYDGVGTPRAIKDELVELLRKEGKTWRQVVSEGMATHAWKEDPDAPLRKLKQEAENAIENLKEISVQLALGDELAPNWTDPVLEKPPAPPSQPTTSEQTLKGANANSVSSASIAGDAEAQTPPTAVVALTPPTPEEKQQADRPL